MRSGNQLETDCRHLKSFHDSGDLHLPYTYNFEVSVLWVCWCCRWLWSPASMSCDAAPSAEDPCLMPRSKKCKAPGWELGERNRRDPIFPNFWEKISERGSKKGDERRKRGERKRSTGGGKAKTESEEERNGRMEKVRKRKEKGQRRNHVNISSWMIPTVTFDLTISNKNISLVVSPFLKPDTWWLEFWHKSRINF